MISGEVMNEISKRDVRVVVVVVVVVVVMLLL
jgi:hypothetical protein